MKVDKEKLEDLIASEIMDIRNSPYVDSAFAIGEVDGVEVQLKFTKELDEFYGLNEKLQCIS